MDVAVPLPEDVAEEIFAVPYDPAVSVSRWRVRDREELDKAHNRALCNGAEIEKVGNMVSPLNELNLISGNRAN